MRFLSRPTPIVLLIGALLWGCAASTPYQGMNLEEVFEEGMRDFEDGDWDDAIRAFETVLFGAPGSEEAPIARWHLAEAHYRNEEYVTAAQEFTRFLERFPNHERAPQAAFGVCRAMIELSPIVQRDQTDTRRAHTSCSAAAQDFPDTPQSDSAASMAARMEEKLAEKVYVGGEFYFERDLFDSAILYYEDVVDTYPDSEAAPKALQRMYEAYQEIGYSEEARDARQRLLEEYPDSEAARQLQESASSGA